MKSKLIKFSIIFSVLFILSFSITVSAAENLFDPSNSFDGTYFIDDGDGVFFSGVPDYGLGSGKECFYLPGLTRNYTYSGHVKILDIGGQPYNGVRIIVGSGLAGSCNLLITKSWGVRFAFKTSNLNDLFWDTGLRLGKDTEFDFEVIRVDNSVTLKLNGQVAGTVEIPEELDTFDDGGEYNLGFEFNECIFQVSDIAVYCEEAEHLITPTPMVTEKPTQAPTEVPNINTPNASVAPIQTASPSVTDDANNNTDKDSLSPIVIVVVAVAAVAVIGVVFVLVRGKKK